MLTKGWKCRTMNEKRLRLAVTEALVPLRWRSILVDIFKVDLNCWYVKGGYVYLLQESFVTQTTPTTKTTQWSEKRSVKSKFTTHRHKKQCGDTTSPLLHLVGKESFENMIWPPHMEHAPANLPCHRTKNIYLSSWRNNLKKEKLFIQFIMA